MHILKRKLQIVDGRIGPSHDPYAYSKVVITLHKKYGKEMKYTFYQDALGSVRLIINGKTLRETRSGNNFQRYQQVGT